MTKGRNSFEYRPLFEGLCRPATVGSTYSRQSTGRGIGRYISLSPALSGGSLVSFRIENPTPQKVTERHTAGRAQLVPVPSARLVPAASPETAQEHRRSLCDTHDAQTVEAITDRSLHPLYQESQGVKTVAGSASFRWQDRRSCNPYPGRLLASDSRWGYGNPAL